VQDFDERTRSTRDRVRLAEAKQCGQQIASYLRGHGLRKAAFHRTRRALEQEQAELLRGQRDMLAAEDEYAHDHRKYLAAAGNRVERAIKRFRSFDSRRTGEIPPKALQSLAFDLGIVVPMAKIHQFVAKVDLNGNNMIDEVEFLVWYFCQSDRDRARFSVDSLDARGAADALKITTLTTVLAVDKGVRKFKALFQAKQGR